MRIAISVAFGLLAALPARAGGPDITFESIQEFILGDEGYGYAGDVAGGRFTAGAAGAAGCGCFYGYHYSDPWDYWGGWVASNRTVVGADDWLHQFTAAPGADHTIGPGGTYAIGYNDWESPIGCKLELAPGFRGGAVRGAWFANVVWTVEYMNDNYGPDDYYRLNVTGYDGDMDPTGSAVVDLTGVSDWRWCDLDLTNVSVLGVRLSTSDDWTPMYFCVDDVVLPEPATAALLAVGALPVLRRGARRGRKRHGPMPARRAGSLPPARGRP
jgi:hypothetical protein